MMLAEYKPFCMSCIKEPITGCLNSNGRELSCCRGPSNLTDRNAAAAQRGVYVLVKLCAFAWYFKTVT